MLRVRDPEECLYCATRPGCIAGHLAPEVLESVQPMIVRRRVPKGGTVAAQGEVSSAVSVIKVGTVFGYRRGLDGESRPVGIAGRGSVFGLMGYHGQPNQIGGVAAALARVCDIPHALLRDAARSDPAFGGRVTSIAVTTAGLVADWSVGMRVRGVANQLAYALLLMARAQTNAIVELPTHTALSELLGATRETVARAFSTLRAEGCIQLLGRRKCELRLEQLRRRIESRERRTADDEA